MNDWRETPHTHAGTDCRGGSGCPARWAWPCGRHEAHGSHGECPGVPAHPLTQIGRGALRHRTEVDTRRLRLGRVTGL